MVGVSLGANPFPNPVRGERGLVFICTTSRVIPHDSWGPLVRRTFTKMARAKGWGSCQIYSTLTAKGWGSCQIYSTLTARASDIIG